MKPPVRRPSVSLRISVTERCQLHCLYCMPPGGTPRAETREPLTNDEILRFVRAVKGRFHVTKVHVTGGEALCRPELPKLIGGLSEEGITDIALTTNGQRLAGMACELRDAGLKRVNVSLDSLDDRTFHSLTGGGKLSKTLAGVQAALCCGLAPVKINTVMLRGQNDQEIVPLVRFALSRGCHMRFLELMPIGCIRRRFDQLFVSSDEVRSRLDTAFRLEPLRRADGSSSRNFRVHDRHGLTGTVGFISPETEPFCAGCTRVRLTSSGQLIGCLARGAGPNVAGLLREGSPTAIQKLERLVTDILARKQRRDTFAAARPMSAVGG